MPHFARHDAAAHSFNDGFAQRTPPDETSQPTAFISDGFAHRVRVTASPGRALVVDPDDAMARAVLSLRTDPYRSRSVLRRAARTGGRVTASFEESDWDAFATAWRERGAARPTECGTLRLLTGPVTSPTERGLISALLARNPGAHWHVHAPSKDMAAEDGARIAFGRAVAPVHHLGQARCVVALAADPFSDGPAALEHRREAAAARPALFAVEATPGRFGALARHRIALSPARIEALLWRLASRWMPEVASGDAGPVDPEVQAFEEQLVEALRAAADAALVIAGAGLSAEAHALAFALNQRLGAIGRTLTLIEPPDAARGVGTLADLVHALQDGSVDTLVVIGSNPAYDAPASFGMTLALSRARLLVHAGTQVDETAVQADWHLPLSMAFEAWGDALAHDGSAVLLEPLLAAPTQARSAPELLALLAGDELREGQALLRRQWQPQWSHATGETVWRDSLRHGVVRGSASSPVDVQQARLPARRVLQSNPATPTLTALFVPCPFSGLVHDDAVLLSPATAARLGVRSGDIVRAQVEAQAIEAPAWVLTGQADDVATLPLGGGRRQHDRAGSRIGFNAGTLRPATALSAPITLQPTGRRHEFAAGRQDATAVQERPSSPMIGAIPT